MKNIILLLSSLLVISACTFNRTPPQMLSYSPVNVIIDYSSNDLLEATTMAQQFCYSINKHVQYIRTEERGVIIPQRFAFFNCIDK